MLVKIGNKWLRADLITCLEFSRGSVNGSIGYILLASGVKRDYLCGEYETDFLYITKNKYLYEVEVKYYLRLFAKKWVRTREGE